MKELDSQDVSLLLKTIPFLLVELEGEVQTRTGFNESEFLELIDELKLGAVSGLNQQKFDIIKAALGEMLYGFDISKYADEETMPNLQKLYKKIDEN